MAEKERKSMMFFYDWMALFDELEDNEVGQLTKAIVKYAQTGEEQEFADRSMRVVFKAMKNATDLANEKYASIGNARRTAASKRWAKDTNDANAEYDDTNSAKNANAQLASSSNANDALINKNKLKENKQNKNKQKEVLDPTTAFAYIEARCFSYNVEQVVKQWISYKQQRKEGYVEEGLKSLLTQIEHKIQEYGDLPVIDVIELSMSNQWKGIIWEKINNTTQKVWKSSKAQGQSDMDYFLSQAGGSIYDERRDGETIISNEGNVQ